MLSFGTGGMGMGLGLGKGGVGMGMEMGVGTDGMAIGREMGTGGMGMEMWIGTGGMGMGMEPWDGDMGWGWGRLSAIPAAGSFEAGPLARRCCQRSWCQPWWWIQCQGPFATSCTPRYGGGQGSDPTAPCCPLTRLLSPQPGPGPQLLDDPSQHLLGPDGLPCRSA